MRPRYQKQVEVEEQEQERERDEVNQEQEQKMEQKEEEEEEEYGVLRKLSTVRTRPTVVAGQAIACRNSSVEGGPRQYLGTCRLQSGTS
jgi:hypothetical protein